MLGIPDPLVYLVPSATVISRWPPDTVAAIIEGYADSQVNLRMRRWDYEHHQAHLRLLHPAGAALPREDALICLAAPAACADVAVRRPSAWSASSSSALWT